MILIDMINLSKLIFIKALSKLLINEILDPRAEARGH